MTSNRRLLCRNLCCHSPGSCQTRAAVWRGHWQVCWWIHYFHYCYYFYCHCLQRIELTCLFWCVNFLNQRKTILPIRKWISKLKLLTPVAIFSFSEDCYALQSWCVIVNFYDCRSPTNHHHKIWPTFKVIVDKGRWIIPIILYWNKANILRT